MKAIKIFKPAFLLALVASLILINACDDKEYSQDYDVPWPVPAISSFSPEEAMIESELIITGVNLDKTNRVTIGTAEAEIISVSATEVKVRVPRLASTANIKLNTSFKREALSEGKFVAMFPKTTITEWPSKVERTKPITLKGENVDLITGVMIGDKQVVVDGSDGTSEEITISTADVNLSGVDNVVIKVTNAKGGVDGSDVSPSIPVQDPTSIFVPQPAIVLFDFENNVNPFVPAGSLSPSSSIDGGGLPKARGDHYLSVTASNVTSWQDIGYIEIAEAVDVSKFTAPHISFLVNTNGNAGYFQLEDGQGNWYHFKQSPDDYMFTTEGWEWRSYNLNQVDDGKPFDLANVKAKLMFKTGNVASGDFEVNIDQVMITDGPINIQKVLFTFEDGVNPYVGTATASVETGSAAVGDKYLSVTKGTVAKYEWTGDMAVNESIDLSAMTDPHISFWVNTGTTYGNLQIEVTQAGTKWGSDPFSGEQNDLGGYAVRTEGEWKLYSFRMSELLTSKWGGDGTAFDPKGTLDYVKFGLSTGNIENIPYEVRIDDVVISDGPMF